MTATCPHCGRPIELIQGRGSALSAEDEQVRDLLASRLARRDQQAPDGWRRKPSTSHQYSTVKPLPRGAYGAVAGAVEERRWSERRFEQPARGASVEGDVKVPLLQSLVTGTLGAVVSGLGAAVVGVPSWWYVPAVGAGVGVVTFGAMWAYLLTDTRKLLRVVEVWTAEDLDGDGYVGQPEPDAVRLEVKREGGGRGPSWLFRDLPVGRDKLETWARAVLGGRGLAVGTWTGTGGLFSRAEYDSLMGALQDAGIVAWAVPGAPLKGRELTRPGRAALQAFVEGKA
jgi:hypothetical protein